jgi:hypothetical protein
VMLALNRFAMGGAACEITLSYDPAHSDAKL